MSEIALRSTELVEWVASEERVQQYAMALPDDVDRDSFTRALKTALISKPDLVKADRASLYLAILNAAQLGLVPDGRQAALVTYGDKVQLIPMIGGVRDILAKYGWMLQTSVVYEADAFSFDEAAQRVMHVPPRLGSDRGVIIGAYAQATHKDGRRMAEVMSLPDIHLVRDKAGRKNPAWSDKQSYPRMVEKTPGHRLAKKLPLDPKDRERIDLVIAAEDIEQPVADMYGRQYDPQTGELTEPASTALPTADGAGGDEGTQGDAATPTPGVPLAPTESQELAALEASMFKAPGGKYGAEENGGTALTIGQIYALGAEGIAYLDLMLTKGKPSPYKTAVEAFCLVSMPAEWAAAMAAKGEA